MSRLDDIQDRVREQKWGMLTDLAFAVVWVTVVTVFFDLVDGPQWAYYMFMLAGVIAYYGFMGGLEPGDG
ncbi:hypothetical protein G9464_07080 [Halostella sp. JP-L12]|uniref:hypothetical protein n=1 Tax=Halostella TaxID=1843185 RepID=UPI000EF799F8|nr:MULTISPECIES: hypothetical protein [Halostella]NHN47357.1 hypothetical protein [Halostella sp. JP-L12]